MGGRHNRHKTSKPSAYSPPNRIQSGTPCEAVMGTGGVQPPSSNTGASVTPDGEWLGVHWLAGTSDLSTDTVLSLLHEVTGESVEVAARSKWYREGYRVGPVRVLASGVTGAWVPMGCHIIADGSACEALGLEGLRRIYAELGLKVARFDVAQDGCPFTPREVADAWYSDDVRTKVKVAADAREDRPWRSCDWQSSPSGDTFYMGSPRAARRVRVYDRRGPVRLELQTRDAAAVAIAADLFAAPVEDFGRRFLSHVRAFVDFVEAGEGNISRRPLAGWWAAFCEGVEKSRVRVTAVVVESFARVAAWVERQVAPMLAVIAERRGDVAVSALLSRGRSRWRSKHARLALGAAP